MTKGYNNRVLLVNLTTGEIRTEEPGEVVFRQYLGGGGLGVWYGLRDIPPHADPFGPENVLVFATGVITGSPVMAASRFSVSAKSPITGGFGDSQGGGFFGPSLKYAGFDAVVFHGISPKPVYLLVKDGKAELKDAKNIWGMTTKDYETSLREEHGREAVVAGIGPAGERLCRFACIINERKHANGRLGMGAVMGSKNLKCIAAIGQKPSYEYADPDELRRWARHAGEWAKDSPLFAGLNVLGTPRVIEVMNKAGMLPTQNFAEGYFEGAEETIGGRVLKNKLQSGNDSCRMCNIACKRKVSLNKKEHGYDVDSAYGGPEYETISSFGSYLRVNDLAAICKCNEICNANGIDTISVGATIAFAMDCYENGILTDEMTDGLQLRFGSVEATIELLNRIIERRGWLGNLLAEGPTIAAQQIGKSAEYYNMSVKGNPMPAHPPQGKKNLALHYAVNPYGADHMTVLHDGAFGKGAFQGDFAKFHYALGIYEPIGSESIEEGNIRAVYMSELLRGAVDNAVVCMFGFGFSADGLYGPWELLAIVNATTGWNMSLVEMFKAADRTRCLMRMFNQREGLGEKDEYLPERIYLQPYSEGPMKGNHVDKANFLWARDIYYDMAGWDRQTGGVKPHKITELNLTWALPYCKLTEAAT